MELLDESADVRIDLPSILQVGGVHKLIAVVVHLYSAERTNHLVVGLSHAAILVSGDQSRDISSRPTRRLLRLEVEYRHGIMCGVSPNTNAISRLDYHITLQQPLDHWNRCRDGCPDILPDHRLARQGDRYWSVLRTLRRGDGARDCEQNHEASCSRPELASFQHCCCFPATGSQHN
jgi:hypothetical protein